MNAAFFDTNILIYATEDEDEIRHKTNCARDLMGKRDVTISTQVMVEFYGVLRRKKGFSYDLAIQWMNTVTNEDVVVLRPNEILDSYRLAERYQIAHWDGLILRAAEKARVDVVYTEDLKHGETYGSVRVCNPFIEDFLQN